MSSTVHLTLGMASKHKKKTFAVHGVTTRWLTCVPVGDLRFGRLTLLLEHRPFATRKRFFDIEVTIIKVGLEKVRGPGAAYQLPLPRV